MATLWATRPTCRMRVVRELSIGGAPRSTPPTMRPRALAQALKKEAARDGSRTAYGQATALHGREWLAHSLGPSTSAHSIRNHQNRFGRWAPKDGRVSARDDARWSCRGGTWRPRRSGDAHDARGVPSVSCACERSSTRRNCRGGNTLRRRDSRTWAVATPPRRVQYVEQARQ